MASKGIDIEFGDDEVVAKLRKQAKWLSPHELAKAGSSAINRAMKSARTHGGRAVRETVAVKAREAKKKIAPHRATPAKLHARLEFDTSPIPLKEYGAKELKRGVSFRTHKKHGRKKVRDYFISKKMGGHVFRREKKGDDLVPRLPVHMVYGPPIGSAFDRAEPVMEAQAKKVMDQRMQHEIEWRVKKANQ